MAKNLRYISKQLANGHSSNAPKATALARRSPSHMENAHRLPQSSLGVFKPSSGTESYSRAGAESTDLPPKQEHHDFQKSCSAWLLERHRRAIISVSCMVAVCLWFYGRLITQGSVARQLYLPRVYRTGPGQKGSGRLQRHHRNESFLGPNLCRRAQRSIGARAQLR